MTTDEPIIGIDGSVLPPVPEAEQVTTANLKRLDLHGGKVSARRDRDGAFIKLDGWTISVIWHYRKQAEAEVMVFDPDGNDHRWKDGNLAICDATLDRIQNIIAAIVDGTLTYTHQDPPPPPETRYDDGWES